MSYPTPHKSTTLLWSFGCLVLALTPLMLAQTGAVQRPTERIKEMSAEELEALNRKKERFDLLSDGEKERLRQIHSDLTKHESCDELKLVLERYFQWQKTLTPNERAELRDLAPEERLRKIREIRLEQDQKWFGLVGDTRLPDEDLPTLFQWVDGFFKSRKDEMVDELRQINRFRGGRSFRESSSNRYWYIYAVLDRVAPERAQQLISEDDIEILRNVLSPDAQAILDNQNTWDDRARLVHRWIKTAVDSRFRPKVTEEQLRDFYLNHLTAEQREGLDNRTPERRRQVLRALYYRRFGTGRRSQEGPKGPPEGKSQAGRESG